MDRSGHLRAISRDEHTSEYLTSPLAGRDPLLAILADRPVARRATVETGTPAVALSTPPRRRPAEERHRGPPVSVIA